jgi:hypothetical protein
MPIRFACPHCRQKLSVSTRKAGQTADCPRCAAALTIPALPAAEASAPRPPEERAHEETLQEAAALGPAVPPAAKHDPHSAHAEPVLDSPPPKSASAAANSPASTPLPPDSDWSYAPDTAESAFDDIEIVYDTTDDRQPVSPLSAADDTIVVPRSIVYLQGGLLAVVAIVSLVIGMLAGGALSGGAGTAGAPQACVIEGTINYSAGNRNLPDSGAVIAVVPQRGIRPDERAPIDGLRPSDGAPGPNHRGLAILRELGGAYARTDGQGRFSVQVPDRGKYLVLAISQARELESLDELSTSDIVKLSPYFTNAADLVGKQRYQLTQMTVRGDERLSVLFE